MNRHQVFKGLSAEEIPVLRQKYGFNELPSSRPKSIFYIILKVVREPMFLLLVSCGILYILLGDNGEGAMLLASVVIVILITFYQEKKTERALDALRDLSSPRSLVIRDGKETRIASRELVPGDILVTQEGDRIPADGFVVNALNLSADESLLTGESAAVRKTEWDGAAKFAFTPGENLPFVYSGSLIVQGHGIVKVFATGVSTQLGRIGKSIDSVRPESTLLEKETSRIVKTFSILGFGLCIILIIVYGITRQDWLHGILTGLSLAMAMLPEEFAVVLTIFMVLGAWRIARRNVLTRNPSAIETLGSVSVLCADKTGTLTENKMTVRKFLSGEKIFDVSESSTVIADPVFYPVMEYAILASQANPFDPMEKAILSTSQRLLADTPYLHPDWRLEKEYPLSPALLAMSRVFRSSATDDHVVAAKGSPEAIADLCHLSRQQKEKLNTEVSLFANEGLRVLGIARAIFKPENLPTQQHDFDFEFLGLVGLEDPLRESVQTDLKKCYDAGIRVIMITGDYPVTAQSIARKMGLNNPEQVITGKDLALLNELQLREKIKHINIFARIMPEQKLMLVQALKANGEIVAMTGDGINDAPALKAANVGIAMGMRGTDVAREAADLVLTDDNFSSIIAAIRSGRRIYDNIRKAMAYIFSVHVPIAGLTVIQVFFPSIPIILFPLHIAFMELIIDPASTLVFEGEPAEKEIMRRKPHDMHKPVFGIRRILISSLQGLSVLLICLAVYFIALSLHRSEDDTRALTYVTLVISNIALILTNRSWTRNYMEMATDRRNKNTSVKWVVAGAVIVLTLLLTIPFLRDVFHFGVLTWGDVLLCTIAGLLSIGWFELLKRSRLLARIES